MRGASLVLSARNLETSDVYFIASLGYAAFYNRTASLYRGARSYCLFEITAIKNASMHLHRYEFVCVKKTVLSLGRAAIVCYIAAEKIGKVRCGRGESNGLSMAL